MIAGDRAIEEEAHDAGNDAVGLREDRSVWKPIVELIHVLHVARAVASALSEGHVVTLVTIVDKDHAAAGTLLAGVDGTRFVIDDELHRRVVSPIVSVVCPALREEWDAVVDDGEDDVHHHCRAILAARPVVWLIGVAAIAEILAVRSVTWLIGVAAIARPRRRIASTAHCKSTDLVAPLEDVRCVEQHDPQCNAFAHVQQAGDPKIFGSHALPDFVDAAAVYDDVLVVSVRAEGACEDDGAQRRTHHARVYAYQTRTSTSTVPVLCSTRVDRGFDFRGWFTV